MTPAAAQKTRLSDYAPYPFTVDAVRLTFRLSPHATRVLSEIDIAPKAPGTDLHLDGERLRLVHAAIDGNDLRLEALKVTDTGLTIPAALLPEGPFTFAAEVEVNPTENTSLNGLYMSNGMYCTQCEAQGFRRITYYPDRPDVMARFTTRIEGPYDVMLSNGNPVTAGPGFTEWHDPWPKPAYLFALVAGELVAHSDTFTTMTGLPVALNLYVRPGDEDRALYAMEALKRSMAWDERAYGRAYDLDVFNVVAVDDFNMGAMENKGLNIFNSKYVLASPETATDTDYENIERIIAHEYFHNWTGNRITCRDWFQLCLKEGLTVFRDQQFSEDARSASVQRIQQVQTLRARQFREDAGPLAHPVRPDHYVEINNFYTATVYEKGAEVIRMLRVLVGEEAYRTALDLYFDRHDGQACTIEDWLTVFEDATGRDLSQFKRWYTQAGTPRLHVQELWEHGTYRLRLRQETAPTPGQPDKAPLVIPVAVALLGKDGREMAAPRVLEMTQAEQEFSWTDLPERPVPSLLRGFSAPVILTRKASTEERAFLLAHDSDPFNRFEAGRSLTRSALMAMVSEQAEVPEALLDGLNAVLSDAELDPAFRALCLGLPSGDDLAQGLHDAGVVPDPRAIWDAQERLREAMSTALHPTLARLYDAMEVPGPFDPGAGPAGHRALQGAALRLLTRRDGGDRATDQFNAADNMTQSLAALTALLAAGKGKRQLDVFYDRWRSDRLVLDKWFQMQATLAHPDHAVALTEDLTRHAAFEWKNPNRFRALMGAFSANPAGFHAPDGSGYRLLADWLLKLDPVNPQTAARLSGAFETWARYDVDRQDMMRAELSRIAAEPGLSRDLGEKAALMLGTA